MFLFFFNMGVWGLGFGVWGLGFGVWGCARAHRPLAHPAADLHAEARKSWQRVPHSAHAWLLDLPNVKPATRGAPPRTLPMGKSPLLSPQKGRRGPHLPQGG